jgi:branched-chain amino acid transport system ATP-binding protein
LADDRGTDAHLRVSGVSAGYGPVAVIHDVTLTVARGEIVTVIGPNGAGKSTLLKAIIGALPLLEGSIALGDERIDGLRTDKIARRGVGYVPQVRDVFEPLTVRENLEMGGYVLPRHEVAARIEEVLTVFPALAPMRDRQAGTLSGGERKMLAASRVLMTRPTLLVLDEPTAGLAPQLAQAMLREHVTRLASTGAAVLLVEQRAREALAISDWAYLMTSGAVLMSERAATLAAREDVGEIFLGSGVRASRS